jgi:hypothetical protein
MHRAELLMVGLDRSRLGLARLLQTAVLLDCVRATIGALSIRSPELPPPVGTGKRCSISTDWVDLGW